MWRARFDWGLAVIILALVSLLVVGSWWQAVDQAACEETGRAAWECRALLRGHGVPVVVPR